MTNIQSLDLVSLIALAFLVCGLLWISVTDWRNYRVPDVVVIPLTLAGILQAHLTANLNESLLGTVAGYLAFWIVEKGFRAATGRDGLGRGDAKLLAAGGAWCGILGLPLVVLIGASTALIFALIWKRGWRAKIPFGPFLSVGILVSYLLK